MRMFESLLVSLLSFSATLIPLVKGQTKVSENNLSNGIDREVEPSEFKAYNSNAGLKGASRFEAKLSGKASSQPELRLRKRAPPIIHNYDYYAAKAVKYNRLTERGDEHNLLAGVKDPREVYVRKLAENLLKAQGVHPGAIEDAKNVVKNYQKKMDAAPKKPDLLYEGQMYYTKKATWEIKKGLWQQLVDNMENPNKPLSYEPVYYPFDTVPNQEAGSSSSTQSKKSRRGSHRS